MSSQHILSWEMLIIKISEYKNHFSLVQVKVSSLGPYTWGEQTTLCNKPTYTGDIKISKELIRISEVLKIGSILVCC